MKENIRDKTIFGRRDLETGRYVTPPEIVDSLIAYPSKTTLQESAGPRYTCALSATTSSRICAVDINPEMIKRQQEFMKNWEAHRNEPPYKAEIEILERRRFDPAPDPNKFEFYTVPESFEERSVPDGDFDRCFAPELILHPAEGFENLAIPIFTEVYNALINGGKFMLTAYPPSHTIKDNGCLDKYFEIIAMSVHAENVVDGNWINIENLSSAIDQQTYEENKSFFDRFWIRDLSRIRLYTPEEIKELSENRFRVLEMQTIPGGMFPFATRHFYVLEKV